MTLLSAGKSYTKTAPSATYPDTGNAELTDGAIATTDYLNAAWVGWQNTNVTVRVDLGASQQLGGARFHFGVGIAGGINCPSQVVISGSNNDSAYTTLGTFVKVTDWDISNGARWSSLMKILGAYRYVKFVFTYQTEWTFLSEIEIYDLAYQQPVTDRTAADVANRGPKAFLNAADWDRINGNSYFVKVLLDGYLSTTIAFDVVARTQFPAVTDLNNLCHNIERLRAALDIFGLSPIKYTWLEGADKMAPNYTHVNQWELTLETIEQFFVKRKPRTGVAGAGRGLTRNNGFRG